ncbi:hypothetical protein HLB23_02310 [Nocardia uniformis]|uniref:Uncharacterized protein n=1 Tax=Nocardia uniformis TaxID=53432 RepID=A0A849BQ62_9NOCA|nr:hypothetical protein [Nocardia uniformis]NNH68723.1 hypothetical protein [Nocardia uniformis]
MTDASPPIPPPRSGDFDPTRLADSQAAYMDSNDRLIRRLFDIGLRLHTLRAEIDHPDPAPERMRAAGTAVGEILDGLDIVIRDAGLAMLSLAREHTAPGNGDGGTVR